jgi:glutaconate CoA-transferase, subunit A
MNTTKQISMETAVALLPDGEVTLALGGNSMHRVPLAFVRAVARRTDLRFHLVKTAGAYDIDLLCLTGRVSAVSAGFIGYETEFGLARHYRRAVESGATEGREHACYTVITAMRAAAYGVSFLPVRGLDGSDLPEARGFRWVDDPYGSGDRMVAISAIRPDLAVIHVQYADETGNGVIMGPKNEDLLMARAARHVVLTTERIVRTAELPVPIDHVDIPSVLVDGVVLAPGGASPGSCSGEYGIDSDAVRELIELPDTDTLATYLDRYAEGETR